MSAMPSPLFPEVPERIADIIFALCQTLTARLRTPTLTHAQLTYIVGRLLGIRTRFRRLVARIRAGHPPSERAPRPRAPAPEFPAAFPLGFRPPPKGWRRWAVRPDKPVPLWRSLRQHGFAWLLPLAPNVPEFRDSAVAHRALLLSVLAEPRTQALLLANRRVGDSLRPLCWMLGIVVSVLYPTPLVAGAAVVSGGDAVPSAPVATAARGVPDPIVDGTTFSAFGARFVATAEPIVAGVIEPLAPRARGDGDLFSTA